MQHCTPKKKCDHHDSHAAEDGNSDDDDDEKRQASTPSPHTQREKNPRVEGWDALMEEQIKAPSLVPRAATGTRAFLLEEYII